MIQEETGRWILVPAQVMMRLDETETPTRMRFVFFDGDERACDVARGAEIGPGIARTLQRKVRETGEVSLW
jgi:hypothetical protein